MENRHLHGMKKMDNNGEHEFLRAEVQTGLTFSKIALQSRHQEKTDRNRANARKAYDCLLRFMPRVTPTTGEWGEIRASVAELKSNLQQLGVTLEAGCRSLARAHV